MKRDYLRNSLLIGTILSVWTAIILFAGNWIIPVEAQTNKKQYGLAAINKSNTLVYDGSGTTVLSATGLQQVLLEAPKNGWKIHTVETYNSQNLNGFVVVLEK